MQLDDQNPRPAFYSGFKTIFQLKPSPGPVFQHNINHVLFDCAEGQR